VRDIKNDIGKCDQSLRGCHVNYRAFILQIISTPLEYLWISQNEAQTRNTHIIASATRPLDTVFRLAG
jgi:hypothetical protein